MRKLKRSGLWCVVVIAVLLCLAPQNVIASEVPDKWAAEEELAAINDATLILEMYPSMNKSGKTTIHWYSDWGILNMNTSVVQYEFQIAKDKNFKNAKTYTASQEQVSINKKYFGTNGGKYYCRVRAWGVSETGEKRYSAWSGTEEYTFLKINKTNFPGLYTLLKNGGEYREYTASGKPYVCKVKYDGNKDLWLDPDELYHIIRLTTISYEKIRNGQPYSVPTCTVSNLKGIENFPNLVTVNLAQYSGKTMNLSKTNVTAVRVEGITATQFTLNAPDATNVYVAGNPSKRLRKVDLSKCGRARSLQVDGSTATTQLKLPTSKKALISLSISKLNVKSINLNSYTNLRELYFYECGINKLGVNKCKKLQYLYFYYCDNMKKLDVRANKKLNGMDFYYCDGIQKTQVKTPKKTKVTYNKGKWWYQTKAWQRLRDSII